nr:hypothetical protein [uncultured Kingella sp.]
MATGWQLSTVYLIRYLATSRRHSIGLRLCKRFQAAYVAQIRQPETPFNPIIKP